MCKCVYATFTRIYTVNILSLDYKIKALTNSEEVVQM